MFSPLFHLHNQFMEIIPINQQFRIVAGIRLDSFGEEAFPVNRKYFPERLHGNVFPTPAGSGQRKRIGRKKQTPHPDPHNRCRLFFYREKDILAEQKLHFPGVSGND